MESNKEVQRKRMMSYFIKAAEQIIEEEGVDHITIRKVANRAAYNSATLYNYFKDLDHLIFFTLIKYTKNYVLSLSTAINDSSSPYEVYMTTWKLFCMHAFSDPYCFHTLFFTNRCELLKDALHEYYQIFPEELENQSRTIIELLSEGNFFVRNEKLLRTLWPEEMVDSGTIGVMNNLVVYTIQSLLHNKSCGIDTRSPEELTREMLNMVHYVNSKMPDPAGNAGDEA